MGSSQNGFALPPRLEAATLLNCSCWKPRECSCAWNLVSQKRRQDAGLGWAVGLTQHGSPDILMLLGGPSRELAPLPHRSHLSPCQQTHLSSLLLTPLLTQVSELQILFIPQNKRALLLRKNIPGGQAHPSVAGLRGKAGDRLPPLSCIPGKVARGSCAARLHP